MRHSTGVSLDQGWGVVDSLAVVIDDLSEGVEPSVVHVRSSEFDVAQGGDLEAANIGAIQSDVANAAVVVPKSASRPVVRRQSSGSARLAPAVADGTVAQEKTLPRFSW